MDTKSDTVLDVRLHTLEDLSSSLDGQHNGRESRGQKDDIGSGLSSFR